MLGPFGGCHSVLIVFKCGFYGVLGGWLLEKVKREHLDMASLALPMFSNLLYLLAVLRFEVVQICNLTYKPSYYHLHANQGLFSD